MKNLIKKSLDLTIFKTCSIFAIIYWLLFNFRIAIYKYEHFADFNTIYELLKDFLIIYASLVVMFFSLTIHKMLFLIGSLFLFITASVATYYLHTFQITPSLQVKPLIFSPESSGIYELLNIKFISWLIFCISICIYTYKHFNMEPTKLFITKILAATSMLITITNIIDPYFDVLKHYFPVQYLHSGYLYLSGINSI